jgi:trigger factor
MDTTVEKKPHAEAVVSGTLSVTQIDAHFGRAVDRFVRNIELPGFRKGKAPKERVLHEVGEVSIWREAAEAALRDELADILKSHSLVPILTPTVTLTATDAHVDVPFSITVVTAPTVEIKDYKASATAALKKIEKLDSEKERTGALTSLNTQVRTMLQKTDDTPITDDEAKKIGFENVAALTHFIDGEADKAVEQYDTQRRRSAVAEQLLKDATVVVPHVFIQEEARAMLETTKQEIARQGLPFNEYLAKRGKTEAEILDEMLPTAEKRVALDLVFAKIADAEKIKPDEKELHRIAHALMHQGAPEDRAHQYGAEMSIREQIWVALGVSEPKPKEKEEEKGASEPHDHSDPHHTH